MFLAKPTPAVSVDEKGEWKILMQSAGYLSVEELARPEPKTSRSATKPNNFAPSRQTYFNELTLLNIRCDWGIVIRHLPILQMEVQELLGE